MKITIWGGRGSIPSPIKPQAIEEKIRRAILNLPPDFDTHDEHAVADYVAGLPPLWRGTAGGNTACVEIQPPQTDEIFIMDAGSGIRELGLKLMNGPCGRGQGVIHLFFSHPHWDHIQGFPFFSPAFVPGNQLFIYHIHPLEQALRDQQRFLNFPVSLDYMQATRTFIQLEPEQPFTAGVLRVNTIANAHPGVAYSYRFEDQHSAFVFASDAEYKQLDTANIEPYLTFFRNADALIFDAQYTLREAWQKVDWGHSSAMIGVDLARAANVKRLLLYHHDPTYSDDELQKIQQTAIAYQAQDTTAPTCEIMVAYEGLTLDLTPPGTIDVQLRPAEEAAILTPASVFDSRGAGQLERYLADLTEQHGNSTPVIDLSQIETLTTASLQSLIALHRKEEGAQVVLANPSGNVQEILKLSGYMDFFAIYPSVEAAISAIKTREALNLPGQMVKNRYRIESKVGAGRLGSVLKATDTTTNQVVALKILSPFFSQETIAHFIRHAQSTIKLEHPNIVKVFSWEHIGEMAFEVEELVTAPSLQEILAGKPEALSAEQKRCIALDIAGALEYAHSRGVVHGDLKPENIFLTETGAKLSGFGLGRLEEGRNLLDAPLIFLTAAYLAPEQILGQTVTPKTDLYALGVILYRLFTGLLPFDDSDEQGLMHNQLHHQPRAPQKINPRISPALNHLILKLLVKNPAHRYPDAQSVRRLLVNVLADSAATLPPHWRSAIVGRERELAALTQRWELARSGRGQLVFITGETGVGKTTLALEAASRLAPPLPLLGQCPEMDGSPPLSPFIQILETYLARNPDVLNREPVRPLLQKLAPYVPMLAAHFPDAPSGRPILPPQHQQASIIDTIIQLVEYAGQQQPWFIILDDLQWADEVTLALLARLAARLETLPIMIIGLAKDWPSSALARHPVFNAPHADNVTHLSLAPLSQADTGRAISQIFHQPAPDNLAEQLHRHTAGNPLYMLEMVKSLVDDGHFTLEDGQWHIPDLEQVRLPQASREAIWRRIHHLSPDTQTLLRQAAVLGQFFSLDDLMAMSGLTAAELLRQLDQALVRHLVFETPAATPTFALAHSEVHYVLYADIGSKRRRLLHRQAASTLARHPSGFGNYLAGTLAHHLHEARRYAESLPYSLQAARHAQQLFANEDALQWYNYALHTLDHLPPDAPAELRRMRPVLHQGLEQVLCSMGWFDEALEHGQMARQTGFDAGQPAEFAALCREIAGVYQHLNQPDTALEWVGIGLQALSSAPAGPEAARLHLTKAVLCLSSTRSPAEAQEHAETSLQLAQSLPDTPAARYLLAEIHLQLGHIFAGQGQIKRAQEAFAQGEAGFLALDDEYSVGKTRLALARLALQTASANKAQAHLRKAEAIFRRLGTPADLQAVETLHRQLT